MQFCSAGTLEALEVHEMNVMSGCGISSFTYLSSVYGTNNLRFDQAGSGICIEPSLSEYFRSITDRANTLARQKRAVLVFFENDERLCEFTKSAYFKKLLSKNLLVEALSSDDRNFMIKKAATKGEVTLSTAIFGRGTDFFCKDQRLLEQGGVHVIQAFLSVHKSEEVQIQGRTARQGKAGSYELCLLESDLESFGIAVGEQTKISDADKYSWLDAARTRCHMKDCQEAEESLVCASSRDKCTHAYFDALLSGDAESAVREFRQMYATIKAGSARDYHVVFCLDESGSMCGRNWEETMKAYNTYLDTRRALRGSNDRVSVITFDNTALTHVQQQPLELAPTRIGMRGGGTQFKPALTAAGSCLSQTPQGMGSLLVFMTDGACGDANAALAESISLRQQCNEDLQVHFIGFGGGAAASVLAQMANNMQGNVYAAATGADLTDVFGSIANAVAEYHS